jgi:2-amino-4-hydroxy-6-hydroxymethyldihydropteridine diphosphokinase
VARAAIGLGSNLGDRLGHLRLGLEGLRRAGTLLAVSSVYETAPVGGPEQGPYLNAVGLIETSLPASDLLAHLHGIEAEAGRVRQERWAARTLDLDLVVYDDLAVDLPGLELPHPRAHERRFVVAPLVDVWPEAGLRSGTAQAALEKVGDQKVALLASDWVDGVPRFLERGGGWVASQGLLLILWAAAFVTSAQFPPRAAMWIGLLPVVVGFWMATAAVPTLGRGLTPFPAPSPSGQLTTTGPYGLVRHPMYGGILLAVIGASILAGSWWAGAAAAPLGILFYFKSRHEERFLRIVYPAYPDYARSVPKRLLPGII